MIVPIHNWGPCTEYYSNRPDTAALSHLLQIGNRANSDLIRDDVVLPHTTSYSNCHHIIPRPAAVRGRAADDDGGGGALPRDHTGPGIYRVQYDGRQGNMAERKELHLLCGLDDVYILLV